jgi:hypothetical protein
MEAVFPGPRVLKRTSLSVLQAMSCDISFSNQRVQGRGNVASWSGKMHHPGGGLFLAEVGEKVEPRNSLYFPLKLL